MEELLKLIEENHELGPRIEKMWACGASANEIADMLEESGVEAEPSKVEEILSLLQKRRAEVIGDEERVDLEQMKKVAGGENFCVFWQSSQGMGDSCSNRFKNDGYYMKDVCLAFDNCDSVVMDCSARYESCA